MCWRSSLLMPGIPSEFGQCDWCSRSRLYLAGTGPACATLGQLGQLAQLVQPPLFEQIPTGLPRSVCCRPQSTTRLVAPKYGCGRRSVIRTLSASRFPRYGARCSSTTRATTVDLSVRVAAVATRGDHAAHRSRAEFRGASRPAGCRSARSSSRADRLSSRRHCRRRCRPIRHTRVRSDDPPSRFVQLTRSSFASRWRL